MLTESEFLMLHYWTGLSEADCSAWWHLIMNDGDLNHVTNDGITVEVAEQLYRKIVNVELESVVLGELPCALDGGDGL